jgi:hypothetical protein
LPIGESPVFRIPEGGHGAPEEETPAPASRLVVSAAIEAGDGIGRAVRGEVSQLLHDFAGDEKYLFATPGVFGDGRPDDARIVTSAGGMLDALLALPPPEPMTAETHYQLNHADPDGCMFVGRCCVWDEANIARMGDRCRCYPEADFYRMLEVCHGPLWATRLLALQLENMVVVWHVTLDGCMLVHPTKREGVIVDAGCLSCRALFRISASCRPLRLRRQSSAFPIWPSLVVRAL